MKTNAESPQALIEALPAERRAAISNLRQVILKNLPKGFEETINYGMLGYVVPHSLYPAGYHADRKQPLPFLNIASQKNFIAVYHMGLYADKTLLEWFTAEYARRVKTPLDMGKSCIRFKNPALIPLDLIGELVQKLTPAQWIAHYEKQLKR